MSPSVYRYPAALLLLCATDSRSARDKLATISNTAPRLDMAAATGHILHTMLTPNATWHNATSFGGHIYSAHETNAYIKYLGNFSSASDCLDACVEWDAQPGAKCRALDWYSPKVGDPHSQGCYARIDGVFESTSQPGVTSAVLD